MLLSAERLGRKTRQTTSAPLDLATASRDLSGARVLAVVDPETLRERRDIFARFALNEALARQPVRTEPATRTERVSQAEIAQHVALSKTLTRMAKAGRSAIEMVAHIFEKKQAPNSPS